MSEESQNNVNITLASSRLSIHVPVPIPFIDNDTVANIFVSSQMGSVVLFNSPRQCGKTSIINNIFEKLSCGDCVLIIHCTGTPGNVVKFYEGGELINRYVNLRSERIDPVHIILIDNAEFMTDKLKKIVEKVCISETKIFLTATGDGAQTYFEQLKRH